MTERQRGAEIMSAEMDGLLACVHCGFCLDACPTYTRLGDEADSPRGRLHLMRAVAEDRLDAASPAFGTHIDRCLGCRACEPVCPSGVRYGWLLERARAASAEATGIRRSTRLLLRVFGSPVLARLAGLGGRLARPCAGLLARWLPARLGSARFALAMLAGTRPWRRLGHATAAPDAHGAPEDVLALADARRRQAVASAAPGTATGLRVGLLTGCVQEGLYARVNRATEAVLRAHGCEIVNVPAQRCCGALHAHAGELAGAHALARANVAAFEAAGVERIVVNAAGCGAVMKEYAEQLAHDPAWAARAERMTGRVRDLFELLVELGPRAGAPLHLRYTYDAPCHLHHAQGITRAPLDVLAAVPGLEHVPLARADECCGGAGTYGLLHPELGGRILRDKVAAVVATGADVVVTPNPGCMMQIGAGLVLHGHTMPVLHPVELLAESYRRLEE